MAASEFRLVLDTNTLLRGIVGGTSAAARLFRAVDTRAFVVLLSKSLAAEYRFVLNDPEVVERFPGINSQMVELALSRIRYLGDYYSTTPAKFEFPRDPHDAKLIELAITGRASHIITSDKDLLSLPAGRGEVARRFRQRLPRTDVLNAGEFVRRFADVLAI